MIATIIGIVVDCPDPREPAPDWHRGDPPQQLHLDLTVTDLDVGERRVLELGGRHRAVRRLT